MPGLFLLIAGAACRRPEPLRHLPLLRPEMISLGHEARPARRMASEYSTTWTIPSSSGGRIELASGLAPEDAAPGLSAEFRAFRIEGNHRTPIGVRTVRPVQPAAWVSWEIPWSKHSSPAELTVEVRCLVNGKPLSDPLATPALLAEPILAPARRPQTRRENVVLFLVDTMRADRLGCYGDRAASTPEFDRLAAEGLRVERVLSAANWTLPAHASLFTSASVARHQAGGLRRALGPELPTLAETLQAQGYRTLAVTNGGFVDPNFGIARGFDRYWTIDINSEGIRASVARALALLGPYRDEPVFVFFHTYRLHQYPHELGKPPGDIADASLLSKLMNARYDEDVTRCDAGFGDMRRGLARLGIAARTVLILTSDHGEMLNDRPETIKTMLYGHSHPYLHDEENRIPLILLDPRRPGRGRVLPGPASLLDIAPTVLDILGAPPNPSFEGVPLSRLEREPDFARARTLVTEEPHNECLAVERGGAKLIVRPRKAFRSLWWGKPYGPIPPLEGYDLKSDPGEKRDLGSRVPELDRLEAGADRAAAEHFPGSLVVRVPAAAPKVALTFRAESGIRRAMLFASRDGDTDPSLDASGAAHLELPSGGSRVWMAVQPNRALDLLQVDLAAAGPIAAALGDGEALSPGERRLRWSALLPRGEIPERDEPLLLYASSLEPPKDIASGGLGPTAENIAQLRSLGYLNLPGRDSGAATGAPGPAPSGPGPGILIVKIREAGSGAAR